MEARQHATDGPDGLCAACSDASGASGLIEASENDEDLPSALEQPSSGSDGDDARSSDTDGDPAILVNGHQRSTAAPQLPGSPDASGTLLHLCCSKALCQHASDFVSRLDRDSGCYSEPSMVTKHVTSWQPFMIVFLPLL